MKRPPRIVAASIAGHLFRLIPSRQRQRAAIAISRFVPFANRYRAPFETRDDTRARIVLRAMGYAAVRFPLQTTLTGAEELSGPAVIVTTHLFLNGQLLRALIERGHQLAIVRASPADPPWITGTAIPLENLLISPTIFVRLRKRLANGEIAFISIDGSPDATRWQMHGLYLSERAIAFARRLGIPVYFAKTRIEQGSLVAELQRTDAPAIDAAMEEFINFMTVAPSA